MSLRGAKRRGNPFSLRWSMTESSTLGEYAKRHEFARGSANLPGFSAGTRIATPVCALVRNDMLKTGRCARVQGRFRQYTGSAPWQTRTHSIFLHVIARSIVACADTWQISACHCEERSDVAIRFSLRWSMTESSTLGEYAKRHEFARGSANLQSFSAGRTDCHTSVRTGSQ